MATESHAYKSNWSKLGNYELQKKVEETKTVQIGWVGSDWETAGWETIAFCCKLYYNCMFLKTMCYSDTTFCLILLYCSNKIEL